MDKGTTYKIQKKLANEIDNIMKEKPDLFYRTRTDFICDALRRHVKYIKGENL